MSTFTIYPCSLSVSSLPFGIPCHLKRHPLQHVAVACCAMKTGWPFGAPRIGVWLPSFLGSAGARRRCTISAACLRTVSIPFSRMYFLSPSERWKRLRNLDFERRSVRSCFSHSSWEIFSPAVMWTADSAGLPGVCVSCGISFFSLSCSTVLRSVTVTFRTA